MELLFENLSFTNIELSEAKSKGEVLGRVKGPSFFSDGYSRNGRFYPKKLWENALANQQTKTKIKKGLMFGCIGHPKDYTLDELLESGKVSHKVVDINIDPKTGEGIAEYEILDTPAGRILNTILRSGSEMYVSTRAFGGFTNETKKKDGKEYKVLDEKNFELESIDFVIEPGFLQTKPKLMESIAEDMAMLAEDKAHIKCEEGLCSLAEDMQSVNEDNAPEQEDEVDMFENIGDLSKEDIIAMLKNVVAENKMLSDNNINEIEDTDDTDDKKEGEVEVDAKLLSNYVSYVELLTKMVRYNAEYEKYYEDLIEFLDKDDKLSTKDIEEIGKITESILKEKDIDESLEKICTKIQNLTELLGDDAEDNEEKDKEKEQKASESVSDFMADLYSSLSVQENTALVLKEAEVNDLKSQVARLREATIALSEQTLTPEVKEVEVEKVVEKVVAKTPKEITEKLIESKSLVESITAERDSLQEKFDALEAEKAQLVLEYETQIKDRDETIEENLGFSREIKQEDDMIIEGLNKKVKSLDEDFSKQKAITAGLKKKLTEAEDKAHESHVGYLSSVYRVEKSVVEHTLKIAKTEGEVKKLLQKKAKNERKSEQDIEVPEYQPRKREQKAESRIGRLME